MLKMKKIGVLVCSLCISCNLLAINTNASTVTSTGISEEVLKRNTVEDQKIIKLEEAKIVEKTKQLTEKVQDQKGTFSDPKLTTDNKISTLSALGFGSYPTRNGVILVTTDNTTLGIAHGHAGIIYTATTTIESNPGGRGVQRLANNWNSQYNVVYGVSANDTTAAEDNTASNEAASYLGKGYNYIFTYTSGRSLFYCSQLVWASFKDLYGINLDDDGGIIWPADLALTNNVNMIYAK